MKKIKNIKEYKLLSTNTSIEPVNLKNYKKINLYHKRLKNAYH